MAVPAAKTVSPIQSVQGAPTESVGQLASAGLPAENPDSNPPLGSISDDVSGGKPAGGPTIPAPVCPSVARTLQNRHVQAHSRQADVEPAVIAQYIQDVGAKLKELTGACPDCAQLEAAMPILEAFFAGPRIYGNYNDPKPRLQYFTGAEAAALAIKTATDHIEKVHAKYPKDEYPTVPSAESFYASAGSLAEVLLAYTGRFTTPGEMGTSDEGLAAKELSYRFQRIYPMMLEGDLTGDGYKSHFKIYAFQKMLPVDWGDFQLGDHNDAIADQGLETLAHLESWGIENHGTVGPVSWLYRSIHNAFTRTEESEHHRAEIELMTALAGHLPRPVQTNENDRKIYFNAANQLARCFGLSQKYHKEGGAELAKAQINELRTAFGLTSETMGQDDGLSFGERVAKFRLAVGIYSAWVSEYPYDPTLQDLQLVVREIAANSAPKDVENLLAGRDETPYNKSGAPNVHGALENYLAYREWAKLGDKKTSATIQKRSADHKDFAASRVGSRQQAAFAPGFEALASTLDGEKPASAYRPEPQGTDEHPSNHFWRIQPASKLYRTDVEAPNRHTPTRSNWH